MLYAASDATTGLSAGATTSSRLALSDFPGEEPNSKELKQWVKETRPLLDAIGYEAILRSEVPPQLLHLTQNTT